MHYNLVHKFISMLQRMKIPDAKTAVNKEKKKKELETWSTYKLKK